MGISILFQLQWYENGNETKMKYKWNKKENASELLIQRIKAFSSLVNTNGVFTGSYSWLKMVYFTHGIPTHQKPKNETKHENWTETKQCKNAIPQSPNCRTIVQQRWNVNFVPTPTATRHTMATTIYLAYVHQSQWVKSAHQLFRYTVHQRTSKRSANGY